MLDAYTLLLSIIIIHQPEEVLHTLFAMTTFYVNQGQLVALVFCFPSVNVITINYSIQIMSHCAGTVQTRDESESMIIKREEI